MDTENRQTDVRGEEVGGWVRRVKGLRAGGEKRQLMDTNCFLKAATVLLTSGSFNSTDHNSWPKVDCRVE